MVAKAEYIQDKENPHFIVTSLDGKNYSSQMLYEKVDCARGEMENRIKDQMSLFADRMSTDSFRSNQLRLYLSSFAYSLMLGLRQQALQGKERAKAQPQPLRRQFD